MSRGGRVSRWRDRARPAATAAAAGATLLTSLGLLPVFRTAQWLPAAAIAVVVVAGAGLVGRAIRVPAAVMPLLQAAAVLTFLTALYAPGAALLRFVPSPAALETLRALVRSGMNDSAALVIPVPVTAGLLPLTVGALALVAIAVDALAVGFGHPALAGVPLLGLYIVTSAVLWTTGVPAWAFVAGAAGWLLLLAVDQRGHVRRWGRAATGRPPRTTRPALSSGTAPSFGPVPSSRPALSSGPRAHPRRRRAALAGTDSRRLAVAAVLALAAAVVLPSVVPGFTAPLFARLGSASGDGATVNLDPLVSLRRDLVDNSGRQVATYTTDDGQPRYLRMYALENFDGQSWSADTYTPSPRRRADRLPALTDYTLSAQPAVTAITLKIGELGNSVLPLPYPARDLAVSGAWYFDADTQVIFSPTDTARGKTITANLYDLPTSARQLRAATAEPTESLRSVLAVPADLPSEISRIASQVTSGATNPYDRARALQDWFTRDGGFRYSTTVSSGSGEDHLVQFLRERVGYCEQFAAAMAIMARTLGIPARVDVGFTGGKRQQDGSFVVAADDAHAWPELWFGGVGWVRFEPTPRADAAGVTTPPYAAPETSTTEDPPSLPEPTAAAEVGEDPATTAAPDPEAEVSDGAGAGRRFLVVAIVAAALLAGAAPGLARALRRRRRLTATAPAALAEGAWAELRDSAVDYGLPWRDADTPRQAGARLVSTGAVGTAESVALQRIVQATEHSRYARAGAVEDDLGTDVAAIRRGFDASVTRWARLRARLMPRSLYGERP
ncbi:MAG: transglutaminase domain-containing protein [Actinomycetota bacterium]|nr:MAG: transglutaminase domain-containing protein [Actinomycetota bacterium]